MREKRLLSKVALHRERDQKFLGYCNVAGGHVGSSEEKRTAFLPPHPFSPSPTLSVWYVGCTGFFYLVFFSGLVFFVVSGVIRKAAAPRRPFL